MIQIPIGTEYERLTTISETFKKNGRTYITCQCTCGTVKDIQVSHLREGHTRSCGCLQRENAGKNHKTGSDNHMWKGGRYVDKSGYALRYVGINGHPRYKKRYVLEHVLVMENLLGRYLFPGENVHHKNGVRDDNRSENLELWVTSQPCGQRPEDLLKWADEIILRYRGAR